MARFAAPFVAAAALVLLLAGPARAEDPYSTWHIGLRGGVFQPVNVDALDYELGYLAAFFLQTPTLGPSTAFKVELGAELGFVEGEGDETLEDTTGTSIDLEVLLVNLRGNVVFYPGLVFDDPGAVQVFVFSGLGWSSHDADLEMEGRRIRLDVDEDDSTLFIDLGLGLALGLTPRTMLEFRAGYDLWLDSDLGSGVLFVTGGAAF